MVSPAGLSSRMKLRCSSIFKANSFIQRISFSVPTFAPPSPAENQACEKGKRAVFDTAFPLSGPLILGNKIQGRHNKGRL